MNTETWRFNRTSCNFRIDSSKGLLYWEPGNSLKGNRLILQRIPLRSFVTLTASSGLSFNPFISTYSKLSILLFLSGYFLHTSRSLGRGYLLFIGIIIQRCSSAEALRDIARLILRPLSPSLLICGINPEKKWVLRGDFYGMSCKFRVIGFL